MIEINLLPREMWVWKKGISFPFQRWLTLGFILFFIIWLFLLLESAYIGSEIGRVAQNLQGIQATYGDTQRLADKLDKVYKPSIDYFNKYIKRRMLWAPALNIISDDLPDNIWLTLLKEEETGKFWLLTLRGAARPFKGRSSIRIIGDYVSELRNGLVVIEKTVPLSERMLERAGMSELEVTTTTKRKVAGNIEITEFLAVFTRSNK